MNQITETRKKAVEYLERSGATDVRVEKNGGVHDRLLYTLNGVECFHVLSSTVAHRNNARDLMRDLQRDVRERIGEPDQKFIKVSMVRTGTTGKFACRIAMSRQAYDKLNPNKLEYLLISWDNGREAFILEPTSVPSMGYKLTHLETAGKLKSSIAWVIQTSATPNWVANAPARANGAAKCAWSNKSNKVIVSVPEHILKKAPAPELGPVDGPENLVQNAKTGTMEEGRAVLAMLNEWLLEQQVTGGKEVLLKSVSTDKGKILEITVGEKL